MSSQVLRDAAAKVREAVGASVHGGVGHISLSTSLALLLADWLEATSLVPEWSGWADQPLGDMDVDVAAAVVFAERLLSGESLDRAARLSRAAQQGADTLRYIRARYGDILNIEQANVPPADPERSVHGWPYE